MQGNIHRRDAESTEKIMVIPKKEAAGEGRMMKS
jgi:hypothetical protein